MLKQYLFFLLVSALFFCGCSTSKQVATTEETEPEVVDRGYDAVLEKNSTQSSRTRKQNEKVPSNLSLADMLRQQSGVSVSGQGSAVRVRVHGIGSFGPSDPLYVINGNPLGNSYAEVAGIINPNDIVSITVLKGNDAAIYGSRGGNGVIVIRTR